ncbi:uncharacterized protein LOC114528214 isoform X1 [Dendronephthya gigantea]|uniref:uncharacterized protein LOC114528214 isoform X1 n=1 Tax=Dendronephthya gigantea TaxID=151771 RepID=UPI00106D87DE|nr:uncharacterized protein LOC114528214 isoform X1 [Dendronephthya gigantea]XP_028405638.1 uncharacterized protein LOC114528214 isoform X1 [Dendronephthya gigantea]
MFRLFRKGRNNNGNSNQSRNQKPDSNEGFFESQAAKFVSKMGMELDKEIVVFPEESGEEARKGITVNSIHFGTYFHGFGLRSNDIIFSVNDLPIISADLVNKQLRHTINISPISQLIMRLKRPHGVGYKYVELNNKGDEPRHKSGELEYLPDAGTCKIKSVYYDGKYLTVDDLSGTNQLISDTNATNNSIEFTIRQYQPSVWLHPLNPEFVTLQHNASGEYILIDNNGLLSNTQIHPAPLPSPPPSPPPTPPPISNTNVYLFQVIQPHLNQLSHCNCPSNFVTFQPINGIGTAIGFKSVNGALTALLMTPGDCKTHFLIF